MPGVEVGSHGVEVTTAVVDDAGIQLSQQSPSNFNLTSPCDEQTELSALNVGYTRFKEGRI